jgi:hypothetical protein
MGFKVSESIDMQTLVRVDKDLRAQCHIRRSKADQHSQN